MRVPFFGARRKRHAAAADRAPVPPPPLPRRRPGTHGARAVKVDPAAVDPALLRKVLDRLSGR
jgi:hypothetical protein